MVVLRTAELHVDCSLAGKSPNDNAGNFALVSRTHRIVQPNIWKYRKSLRQTPGPVEMIDSSNA